MSLLLRSSNAQPRANQPSGEYVKSQRCIEQWADHIVPCLYRLVNGGDLNKEKVINWRPFADSRAAYEVIGQFEIKLNVEWREVHHPLWGTYKEVLYSKNRVALPPPWKMVKGKISSKLKVGYSEPLGLAAVCQCNQCVCGCLEC